MRARRVVMVSCDPATGARDLRAVVEAGFRLDRLVPIDAFPRTHHLEWVATLSRP
jgi:23S rRNA (uracil1939-C5)-methyltransferase